MKFNIDVCIFLCSSIEYTHISISIFDNLKYILKKEKEAALYLGVRCTFIFLLSTMNDCKCVAFCFWSSRRRTRRRRRRRPRGAAVGTRRLKKQTSTKLRPPLAQVDWALLLLLPGARHSRSSDFIGSGS